MSEVELNQDEKTEFDPYNSWGSKLRAKLNCQKSLPDQKLVNRDAALLDKNFEALAIYLKDQIDTLREDKSLNTQTQKWIAAGSLDALNGQRLKTIFIAAAKNHHALMRSECIVASASAQNEILQQSGDNVQSIPRAANPRKLSFGFVHTKPNQADKQGSFNKLAMTFPIVALPDKITRVEDLTIHHPMVKSLQKIYSLTNHDWLHHMTLSAVSKGICAYKNDDKTIEKWSEKYFANSYTEYPVFDFGANETLYEGWAVYTNAQLLNASPVGKEIKAEILMAAMEMINHGKDYIEQNNNSDRAMKTAYWFMLQTTKTLRSIIPVDGFEMRKFIEAAAQHLPHPDRYTDQHIEHIKYRLFEGHDAMCLLQSPHLAHDEVREKKYENFRKDNAKMTAEVIAHLDQKFA